MFDRILPLMFILLALLATACTPAASTETTAPAEIAASAPEEEATEEPVAESGETATDSETADTEAAETDATAVPEEEIVAEDAEVAGAAMTKLNLNEVTGDELLATIPDFGNRMVREFQEYRPYVSIQQFRREIGKYVDETQVAFYEEYVYVPISVNDSDAATLMQIPGLDEAAAEQLMAARPFDSTDAFLQTLAEVAPAVDGALAQAFLEAQ